MRRQGHRRTRQGAHPAWVQRDGVDYDPKLKVYILPAFIEKEGDPDSGRPKNRLEYQVSNGLDGKRSTAGMSTPTRRLRLSRRCAWRRGGSRCASVFFTPTLAECNGGKNTATNESSRSPAASEVSNAARSRGVANGKDMWVTILWSVAPSSRPHSSSDTRAALLPA